MFFTSVSLLPVIRYQRLRRLFSTTASSPEVPPCFDIYQVIPDSNILSQANVRRFSKCKCLPL